MKHTIIPTIIISALVANWACKVEDEDNPDPVACDTTGKVIQEAFCIDWCWQQQTGVCENACNQPGGESLPWCGDDTETSPGTWGTGDGGSGSGSDGSGSGTTGEQDFPCGEGTYLHECAFAVEPVYLIAGGDENDPDDWWDLGQLQSIGGDARPRLCYSSEPGGSPVAQQIAGGYVCGMMGMPEEQACQMACENLTAGIMGIPTNYNTVSPGYSFLHVNCIPADEADSANYTGTCEAGVDGDVTITGMACPEEFCEEPSADSTGTDGGQELDCTTYDGHGNMTSTQRGRTYEIVVDESWADHLLDYPGDVAKCDPGFYDWTLSPHKWQGLKSGSFFYAAGVRNNDELVEVWEHDSNHDMVSGTRVVINDIDDAFDIIDLLPDNAADLALTFKFKRGIAYYTFHLDPR